jgi:hypothetical protein
MASKGHDFIVASISRKIIELGFQITHVDGLSVDISSVKPQIPPKILNHKPDIIGANLYGNFCVGEAKTKNDLDSKRTKQQLSDFSKLVNLYSGNYLIIGIPLSAETKLANLINKHPLNLNSIIILKIPDILLK